MFEVPQGAYMSVLALALRMSAEQWEFGSNGERGVCMCLLRLGSETAGLQAFHRGDTAMGSATPAGPGGFAAVAFTVPSALATVLQNILVAVGRN